jgi:hypothetical protein
VIRDDLGIAKEHFKCRDVICSIAYVCANLREKEIEQQAW